MPHRRPPATAEQFRCAAENCRKQARQTADAVARGVYNDLAAEFERRADEALADGEAGKFVERRSGSRRRG
jgi:hypothetical protein